MPFTPLEQAVIQALGWDLRDIAPDLAGQFEESLPGARRNTGAGLYTEMIVDPHRPPPKRTPSGSFGTVHAMVGDLPGSMAFKARLREGVLMGLEGDAFDMDTSAIDFRTTPFDRVFTVDDQGRSIAFDPAILRNPAPCWTFRRGTIRKKTQRSKPRPVSSMSAPCSGSRTLSPLAPRKAAGRPVWLPRTSISTSASCSGWA
ncbi:hypothetical protein [Brevundimonas goettingensis]|uniref:Uncharacterized protein n=1 Tax=Brevundimonas goettingensis TaxID=2774190 RepID=A0A975C0I3_9CAUL|nr:hypothetical protein [Brevundimonas goettingensis]QTC91593.1 hypothetical protein IFJ75_01245 [Brevundimonas goettingensis]